jgi:DNA polymerase III epsilon subunit-like protein
MSKQDVANWARRMLNTPGVVILDTETTGLNDGEIVQISVINVSGDVLLDTFVKPRRGIPKDAFDVHGISDEMVANAPGWKEVSGLLIPLLTDRDVVIYNAVYDRKMMHRSAEHAGMGKIDWKSFATFHCAMEEYAHFWGDWNDWHQSYRWQRLTAACAQQGIDQSQISAPAHSALGDCLRTLELLKAMAEYSTD